MVDVPIFEINKNYQDEVIYILSIDILQNEEVVIEVEVLFINLW